MEPVDNVKHPQEDQGNQNPNSSRPPNIDTQIYEGLASLTTLVNELERTQHRVLHHFIGHHCEVHRKCSREINLYLSIQG